MAKFDPSKDKLVKHYGAVQVEDGPRLDVEARQYGEGAPKLQIKRTYNDKPAKLGRLSAEEAAAILPYVEEFVTDATS